MTEQLSVVQPVNTLKKSSRFMRQTLMPGENVVREAHFHWFYSFSAYLSFAFCLALGWIVSYGIYRYFGVRFSVPLYLGFAVGFCLLFWALLNEWTTEIIMTDKRLIHKRGYFHIKAHEVDIEQLASHEVDQSLMGRILGFGTLHVRCIEANDIWLPPIADPYTFRNAIERQKQNYRENFMNTGRIRRTSAEQKNAEAA